MAMLTTMLSSPNHLISQKIEQIYTKIKPAPHYCIHKTSSCDSQFTNICNNNTVVAAASVIAVTALVAPAATAGEVTFLASSLQFTEPSNALSLPTWAIHVSSVAEWVIAMALVWQYGEKSGYESWKGLSWGMVPLLGGAFCACTWHFFYNSESLEVLVALQAALTVIGNGTMCVAAYRIYKSAKEGEERA